MEPLSTESPLWDLENVLLSPHNAGITASYFEDTVPSFVDSVSSFIAGKEVSVHLVDKRAGY